MLISQGVTPLRGVKQGRGGKTRSARPDFIGCGNFDVFGGHWTRSRLQPSCTPSSHPASIATNFIKITNTVQQIQQFNL